MNIHPCIVIDVLRGIAFAVYYRHVCIYNYKKLLYSLLKPDNFVIAESYDAHMYDGGVSKLQIM